LALNENPVFVVVVAMELLFPRENPVVGADSFFGALKEKGLSVFFTSLLVKLKGELAVVELEPLL
jgi:hypothetical protein